MISKMPSMDALIENAETASENPGLSRRGLVTGSLAAGVAAVPAVAAADGDNHDALMMLIDARDELYQRAEAIDEQGDGIFYAPERPTDYGGATFETYLETSGYNALCAERDALRSQQWEMEKQVCELPCLSVRDVIAKLKFVERIYDGGDDLGEEQLYTFVRSLKGLAGAADA